MIQLSYSPGTRSILLIPAAMLLSGLLFLALAKMTQPTGVSLGEQYDSPQLDFLLLRKDSSVEYRNRRRPPPPEEVEELEKFVPEALVEAEKLNVEVEQVSFNVPDIEMGLAVDLSPALANLASPGVSAQMFAVNMPFQQNLRAVKGVNPRYPSRAQRKKIEGSLLAEFIVGTDGYVKPDSIKFIDVDPEGIFENSVIRALRRSQFETMIRNGQAVAYRARKKYNFKMSK